MPNHYKRRNFLIDKEFQGKYILTYFLMAFGGCILFILFFVVLSSGTLSVAYNNYELQVGKTPLILFKELLKAHWLFLTVGGIVIVVLTTFLTHRMAGPLFALNRYVAEMCDGQFGRQLHLRKKDEAKKLASNLNQLNSLLTSKLKRLSSLTDNMDDELGAIRAALPEAPALDQGLLTRIEALNDLSGSLKKEIAYFKIEAS